MSVPLLSYDVTAVARDVTHSLLVIPRYVSSQKHVLNRSSVQGNSFRGNRF